MRSPLYVVAILAIMATLRVPLLAQENSEMPAPGSPPQPQVQPSQSPGFGNPRFVFHRIDGAFLRLDLSTGAVASCSQNTVNWTCVPGREERTTLDREITRLQRDNAMLKNALLQRGVPLPDNIEADQPPAATVAPALASPASPACDGKGGGETVPRPAQTVPPASASPPSAKSGEPDRASRDDAEIERMMAVMEKVWRRLVEMMVNIQRDLRKKG
jgi:hypothetical protein